MTPEQLDEARAKEAEERWRDMHPNDRKHTLVGTIAARLAREGWTPPEPVDPDILAFREWAAEIAPAVGAAEAYRTGLSDNTHYARCFLAGARMAREQEQERAKVLLRGLEDIVDADQDEISHMARAILAKYRGEA